MQLTGRHKLLMETYGDLYDEVAKLLNSADPMGLISIGAPEDEYDPEIATILPRLKEAKSSRDVTRIIHEEFGRWFGEDMAGAAAEYELVSSEIWKAWRKFADGLRNE